MQNLPCSAHFVVCILSYLAKIFRKEQNPRKRTVAHLVFKTRDLAGTCFPCGHIASSATTVVFHSVGATGLAANRLLMS